MPRPQTAEEIASADPRQERLFSEAVGALTAAQGTFAMVPPGEIAPFAEGGEPSDALVRSIEQHGILDPLVVTRGPIAGRDMVRGTLTVYRFQLLAGERRRRAAIHLSLAQVPVFVLDIPASAADDADRWLAMLRLNANLFRRDIVQEMRQVWRLAQPSANSVRPALGFAEIAQITGRSPRTIDRHLTFLNALAPWWRRLLFETHITLAIARRIARLPREAQAQFGEGVQDEVWYWTDEMETALLAHEARLNLEVRLRNPTLWNDVNRSTLRAQAEATFGGPAAPLTPPIVDPDVAQGDLITFGGVTFEHEQTWRRCLQLLALVRVSVPTEHGDADSMMELLGEAITLAAEAHAVTDTIQGR